MYTSAYTLPPPPPEIVCMHRQYQVSMCGISHHLRWIPPLPTQSCQLGHLPPQGAYQPQSTHYLHHHCQLFACAGNIEQVCTGSAIWGESPLSPLDHTNQAIYHLNMHISLSLHITSTTIANCLCRWYWVSTHGVILCMCLIVGHGINLHKPHHNSTSHTYNHHSTQCDFITFP